MEKEIKVGDEVTNTMDLFVPKFYRKHLKEPSGMTFLSGCTFEVGDKLSNEMYIIKAKVGGYFFVSNLNVFEEVKEKLNLSNEPAFTVVYHHSHQKGKRSETYYIPGQYSYDEAFKRFYPDMVKKGFSYETGARQIWGVIQLAYLFSDGTLQPVKYVPEDEQFEPINE